jgi:hypothetical protein
MLEASFIFSKKIYSAKKGWVFFFVFSIKTMMHIEVFCHFHVVVSFKHLRLTTNIVAWQGCQTRVSGMAWLPNPRS